MKKSVQSFLITLAALGLLTGCAETLTFKAVTAGLAASTNDVFQSPDVNLREKNYAAADFLSQQMKPNVRKESVIVAKRLEEADHPGISSSLGISIPREVGLRLMELGYTVYVNEVPPHGNRRVFPAPPRAADYVLGGSYFRGSGQVDVNLRLQEAKTGKMVARFDYPLLMSREVREAVKTPTQIFRVDE